jgi:hypothetical protein
MRQLLMLVGVAAVAGAMYVAAASGSRQSAGPTAKQFAALKKQVAALQKKVKTTQGLANDTAVVVLHCILHTVVPVVWEGDVTGSDTFGYNFTPPDHGPIRFTSALDASPNAVPGAANWRFPGFNQTDPACQSVVGVLGLRKNAASARTALRRYEAASARRP